MERDAVASTSRAAAAPPSPPPKRKRSRRIYDVEDRTTKVDVGSSPGAHWTLSSYKPGSGVAELRSSDLTKLWQSDGNQPHLINIQFARRTCVTHLSIYLDVKQDDSYTPTRIAVKAGTNYHDLTLVRQRTFDAPQGWKHFDMTPGSVDAATVEEEEEDAEGGDEDEEEVGGAGGQSGMGGCDDDDDDEEAESDGIRVWLIQICVLANHLNGKDTHIRRLVVFGPKTTNLSHGQGIKRGPTHGLAPSIPPPPLRSRGAPTSSSDQGQNISLAQLLSLQSAASGDGQMDDMDDGESSAGAGVRRSGLNLFGNIR